MTTTINLTTHSWPVLVTVTSKYGDNEPVIETKTIDPNTPVTTFHISDSTTLTFNELPIPARIEPTTEEMHAAAADADDIPDIAEDDTNFDDDEGDADDTLKA